MRRAELLALVCDVYLCSCPFPIGILGHAWCLIVSIPDLCPLSYYKGLRTTKVQTSLLFPADKFLLEYNNVAEHAGLNLTSTETPDRFSRAVAHIM